MTGWLVFLAAWTAIALVVGVFVGKAIKLGDLRDVYRYPQPGRHRPPTKPPTGRPVPVPSGDHWDHCGGDGE